MFQLVAFFVGSLARIVAIEGHFKLSAGDRFGIVVAANGSIVVLLNVLCCFQYISFFGLVHDC